MLSNVNSKDMTTKATPVSGQRTAIPAKPIIDLSPIRLFENEVPPKPLLDVMADSKGSWVIRRENGRIAYEFDNQADAIAKAGAVSKMIGGDARLTDANGKKRKLESHD